MTLITTSTAFAKRQFRQGIILLIFLVTLIFSCSEPNKSETDSNNLKAHNLASENNQAIFFLPNSYLEHQLLELVVAMAKNLYDPNIYEPESLTYLRSTATAKLFMLKLVKSGGFSDLANKKSKIDRDKAIQAIYTPTNTLELDVVVNKVNGGINITGKNKDGQTIVLMNKELKGLTVVLKDSLLNLTQGEFKDLSFHGSGLVFNFSTRSLTDIADIVRFLDKDINHQHIGITAIMPFGFISSVTNHAKIYFQTSNASFKGTYLTQMTIRNGSSNEVLGAFTLNNDDNPLFRAAIKGQCALETSKNRVISMGNFNYDQSNLSASERIQMDALVKICRDSIASNLVGHSLSPTFYDAELSFILPSAQLSKNVYSSSISYYKQYMVYKMNLRND